MTEHKVDTTEFDRLNQWIQAGKEQRARQVVMQLARKAKLPRAERLELARFARRVSIPKLGIRLLQSIVRPQGRHAPDASPAERAEYAANLSQAGAPEEALGILSTVDHVQEPFALLFQSFALFSMWNYGQAIPLLEQFVNSRDSHDYWSWVGKANLLAALIHEREWERSWALGAKLLEYAKSNDKYLIAASTLMCLAEGHIELGEWSKAENELSEASSYLQASNGRDELHVKKWVAILNMMKTRADSSSLQALQEVRSMAAAIDSWETLRDCDYHLSRATRDEDLFLKLYFGTPFKYYRNRLLMTCTWRRSSFPLTYFYEPESFVSISRAEVRPPLLLIDREVAQAAQKVRLEEGGVVQRLFKALCSDFYKPLNLIQLHGMIFPDRHYNIMSSPAVMRQAMKRLRGYFKDAHIPLEIGVLHNRYHLYAKRHCKIALSQPGPPALDSRIQSKFQILQNTLGPFAFTAHQAATIWGCSDRTALYWLRDAINTNLVKREGKAKFTRYLATVHSSS